MLTLDLHQLGHAFRRRWWTLPIAAVLGALVGLALCLVLPPRYEATALVVIPSDPIESTGIGEAASSLVNLVGLGPDESIKKREELLATFKSRQFIEGFIRDKGLLPVLFPGEFDSDAKDWRDPEDAPTYQDAFELFSQDILQVDDNRRTSLIKITVTWNDPETAVEWINELIRRTNSSQRLLAIKRTNDSLGYLNQELQETDSLEIRELIFKLVEAQMRQKMLASVTDEYAFRVVSPPLPADRDRPVWPRPLLIATALAVLALLVVAAWLSGSSISAGRSDPVT